MNADELAAKFEAEFAACSDERGFPDTRLPARRDPKRGPDGVEYVLITSGGIVEPPGAMPLWFLDESEACFNWLEHARDYAKEQGGSCLYWAERPSWAVADFVGLNQAGMIQDHRLSGSTNITVGSVVGLLAVSKRDGA